MKTLLEHQSLHIVECGGSFFAVCPVTCKRGSVTSWRDQLAGEATAELLGIGLLFSGR